MLDNCLAIYANPENSFLDVWVMKSYGVQESWAKIFSFKSGENLFRILPLKLTEDGDLLIYVDVKGLLLRFDSRNRNLIKRRINGIIGIGTCIAYVASLISAEREI